jgi:Zn-dependent protease with chaperone function
MSFAALGVVLVLAAYAAALVVLSLAVAAAAPWLLRACGPPARQARVLFVACVLPQAGALFVAGALVLPAYVLLEPPDAGERAGLALLALAGLGAAGLGCAAARVLLDQWRTTRLLRAWARDAEPLGALALPAWRVEHPFPLAAVVGVRRPRLLVARQVVDALSPEQLRAVAAHEAGHVAAGDVARRIALRACSVTPRPGRCAKALEACWERAAEAAADAFAAAATSPLHLAGALVKIAALAPPGTRLAFTAPAIAAGGPIAGRVRALLADEAPAPSPSRRPMARTVALVVALAWALSLPVVLPATHGFLEIVVAKLGLPPP